MQKKFLVGDLDGILLAQQNSDARILAQQNSDALILQIRDLMFLRRWVLLESPGIVRDSYLLKIDQDLGVALCADGSPRLPKVVSAAALSQRYSGKDLGILCQTALEIVRARALLRELSDFAHL
ncbi:MAG: hypothetical protein ACYCOU_01895 [Sulfobacillus sp.]